MGKARHLAAGALAALALGGCSSLGTLFGPDATVKVGEVGRAAECGARTADPTVQLFANADAVRAWQAQSGVELLGTQAMLPGAYALVGLGQRSSGGYGLVIGPQAEVEDGLIRLHGTFFAPGADEMTTQALTSPCVLVHLPPGDWHGVEVYDQSGKRRARTAGS